MSAANIHGERRETRNAKNKLPPQTTKKREIIREAKQRARRSSETRRRRSLVPHTLRSLFFCFPFPHQLIVFFPSPSSLTGVLFCVCVWNTKRRLMPASRRHPWGAVRCRGNRPFVVVPLRRTRCEDIKQIRTARSMQIS
ncbi:hypothetical protein LZ31DRAFT_151078 [Colletotrichum somersetense]|nr:hypothetical protein LZ31DRAFT_151078 [Colletotrichum somersetense]